MSNIKKLHSFNLTETIKVEGKDDKLNTYEVIIKSPNRDERDEIDIQYAAWFSKYTSRGIMTRDMLLNKYQEITNADSNNKGEPVLTKKEAGTIDKLYVKRQEVLNSLTELSLNPSPENELKKQTLQLEFSEINRQILAMEGKYESAFDNTAESKASRKIIEWSLLFLSYYSLNGGEPKVLFPGETETDRITYMEERHEKKDNWLITNCLDKLILYYSLWRMGKIRDSEQFKKIEEELNKKDVVMQDNSVTK